MRGPIVGLIAAAGQSSRMGHPKALLEHPQGGSFLRHLVEVFRAAEIARIVVTIPEPPLDKPVYDEVPFGVESFRNELPNAGLSGSVFTAMQAAPDAHGFVITPVDAPFAQVRDVRALADALMRHAAAVVTHRGKPGHPVAFSMARLGELGRVQGGPAGLLNLGDVVSVPSDDERVLANVNTPADFDRWGIQMTSPRGKPLKL